MRNDKKVNVDTEGHCYHGRSTLGLEGVIIWVDDCVESNILVDELEKKGAVVVTGGGTSGKSTLIADDRHVFALQALKGIDKAMKVVTQDNTNSNFIQQKRQGKRRVY